MRNIVFSFVGMVGLVLSNLSQAEQFDYRFLTVPKAEESTTAFGLKNGTKLVFEDQVKRLNANDIKTLDWSFELGSALNADGPVSFGSSVTPSSLIVPSTLAGRHFVIPNNGSDTIYLTIMGVHQDADIDILSGAHSESHTIPKGNYIQQNVPVTAGSNIVVTSTNAVLVTFSSDQNSSQTAVFATPAGTELFGIVKDGFRLVADSNFTSVSIYRADGTIEFKLLNRGQIVDIDANNELAQGYRIVSNKPIGVSPISGRSSAHFVSAPHLVREFVQTTQSNAIHFLCSEKTSEVSLIQNDVTIETKTCQPSLYSVGSVTFFPDTTNETFPVGIQVKSNAPVLMVSENATDNNHVLHYGYENTTYLIDSNMRLAPLNIASLADDNQVNAGNDAAILNQHDVNQYGAYSIYTVNEISSDSAITGASHQAQTETLPNDDFLGTEFVVPFYRGKPYLQVYSPFGDANLNIETNNVVKTIALEKGKPLEVLLPGTVGSVSYVTSDLPILVGHLSKLFFGYQKQDAYVATPAAKEFIGANDYLSLITALESDTQVTVYYGNDSTSFNLDKGQIKVLSHTDLGNTLTALRVVADKPISALRLSQNDMVSYDTPKQLANRFVLPVSAKSIGITCISDTKLTYIGDDNQTQSLECLASKDKPNHIVIDQATYQLSSGYAIESEQPISITYISETDDLRFLNGRKNAVLAVSLPPNQPSIITAGGNTTDNPYAVYGMAAPDAPVKLYVNGSLQQTVTSNSETGAYNFFADLSEGNNYIYTITSGVGGDSKPSNQIIASYAPPAIGQQLGGVISGQDLVLEQLPYGQPYLVTSSLEIYANASLTIKPGARLQFAEGTYLGIAGTVVIEGEEGQPVIFTRDGNNPTIGSWSGITITDYPGASFTADGLLVEYAISGVTVDGGDVNITNSTFRYNDYGMALRLGVSTITNSNFYENQNAGIVVRNAGTGGIITDNVFRKNRYGLLFNAQSGAGSEVKGNKFFDHVFSDGGVEPDAGWGIMVKESGTVVDQVSDNDFSGNFVGIHLDTGGQGTFTNNNILNSVARGVTVLDSGTQANLNTNTIAGNKFGVLVSAGSSANLNGNQIGQNEYGVYLENATSYINADSNVINANTAAGIYATNTTAASVISNNDISSSPIGIMLAKTSSDMQLTGNSIHLNGQGVYAYEGAKGSITGNSITNNSEGIYLLGDGVNTESDPSLSINNNSIVDNTNWAIETIRYSEAGSFKLIDATNNWWGATDPYVIGELIKDRETNVWPRASFQIGAPRIDFGKFKLSENGASTSQAMLFGLNADLTLDQDSDYLVIYDLLVPPDLTLTVPQGVILSFANGTGLSVYGQLSVAAIADNPAQLQGVEDITPSWLGVWAQEGGMAINIDFAEIKNADSAVTYQNGVSGSVTNSTITGNSTGISVTGGHSQGKPEWDITPTINYNNIYANTNHNIFAADFDDAKAKQIDAQYNWWGTSGYPADIKTDLEDITSSIFDATDNPNTSPQVLFGPFRDANIQLGGQDVDLNFLTGAITNGSILSAGKVYLVTHPISVASGESITIASGASIEFLPGAGLIVDGSLNINGTEGTEVSFKILEGSDSYNFWSGLEVNGDVNISYLDVQNAYSAIQFNPGSSGSIQNSNISNNRIGIALIGDGVSAVNNPLPTINYNKIHNNSYANLDAYQYVDNQNALINAAHNWWGSDKLKNVLDKIIQYQKDPSQRPVVDINGYYLRDSLSPLYKLNTSIFYGPISTNTVLPEGDYLIINNLDVLDEVTLTITAGAKLRFAPWAALNVHGYIEIKGIISKQVLFTSVDDTDVQLNAVKAENGAWQGIKIFESLNGAAKNVIEYALIEYAKNGVYFSTGSAGLLSYSTVRHTDNAVFAGSDLPVINYNDFSQDNNWALYGSIDDPDNNPRIINAKYNWWGSTDVASIIQGIYDINYYDNNEVVVNYSPFLDALGGNPSTDNYLDVPLFSDTVNSATLESGKVYIVSKNLTVPVGKILTIEAGAQIEFFPDQALVVEGEINITGTVTNPVVLTKFGRSEPFYTDHWMGIKVSGKNANVTITHADIQRAQTGVHFENGATGNISSSTIKNNVTGISLTGGYSYKLADNDDSLNPWPIINENSIFDNSSFNVYAERYSDHYAFKLSAKHLNVKNNYWGYDNDLDVGSKVYGFYDKHNWSPAIDFGPFYRDATRTSLSEGEYLHGPVVGPVTLEKNATYYNAPEGLLVSAVSEVGPAGKLTITAGAVFKTKSLVVEGSIDAQGTEPEPISFLPMDNTAIYRYSNKPWQGLVIRSNDPSNHLSYVNIRHADSALKFEQGAYALIENALLIDNNYGIYLQGGKYGGDAALNPSPVVKNSQIYDNNFAYYATDYLDNENTVLEAKNNYWGSIDPAEVVQDIYGFAQNPDSSPIINYLPINNVSGELVELDQVNYLTDVGQTIAANTSYVVLQSLTIETGQTMTIPEGVTLKFARGAGLTVNGGTLVIQGTNDNFVKLTSYIDGLNWNGLTVNGAGSNFSVDYAIIEYANCAICFIDAGGSVSNSDIRLNSVAVYITGVSNPTISQNSFYNNALSISIEGDGSSVTGSPQPSIYNNEFISNSAALVEIKNYPSDGLPIILTDNWWESTDDTAIQSRFRFVNSSNTVVDYSNPKSSAPYSAWSTSPAMQTKYFSPNEDGIKDSISISGVLSVPSAWVVTVTDASGNSVWSTNGSGTSYSLTWSGENHTGEGKYSVSVSTTLNGTKRTANLAEIYLDVTPPVANFSADLGAVPIKNVLQLPINGVVHDNIGYDAISVAWEKESNPGVWLPIESKKVSARNESQLTLWQVAKESENNGFTSVPPGSHRLRISVTDMAGNTTINYRTVTFENLTIDNAKWSVPEFNITASQTANIQFDLSHAAEVVIHIYPELLGVNPAPIRTVSQSLTAGAGKSINWDGKDDNGKLVESEAYIFTIEAADTYGGFAKYFASTGKRVFNYNGVLPRNTVFNSFENDNLTVDFNSLVPGRSHLYISPTGSVNQFVRFAVYGERGSIMAAGENTITWDGRLPNGNLHVGNAGLLLGTYSFTENTVVVTRAKMAITGPQGGAIPYINVRSDPYLVYLSYGQFTFFKYNLDQDADVVITLLPPGAYNPSDDGAIEIFNGRQSEGDQEVEWTGIDDADANKRLRQTAKEGAYSFVIQATGTGGSSRTVRGVLNVQQ